MHRRRIETLEPQRMTRSLDHLAERDRQQAEMLRVMDRLQQAERFQTMGMLASGLAHDLNNVLGAILGFGERALRAAQSGTQLHSDLGRIVAAGERGRTLVDRVLSAGRSTCGERMPVHVQCVISEALGLLRATLPAHIRLRSRLKGGSAAILGDAAQIHQLVMNLSTNALHAMDRPGTLTVSLETADLTQPRQAMSGPIAAGPWVVLRVSDQGSGMTPELMGRIFDPFFTTKEIGVGTGLGLWLVLRIVMEAGGAIDVESIPGAGSVFTVHLPRAADASEESCDGLSALPRGNAQRVMVVDDEQAQLEQTTKALRGLGYKPIGCTSSRVALETFRSTRARFDALITDMSMPGISGEMLFREVRHVRPLLPIILVRGDDAPPLSNGWSDEVLTRPLRTDALANSLARLLDAA